MNGMVDSRVVEMHFDNSDFMEKIEETIEALEKLNDQISILNASEGLNNLTSNVGNSNLSNVASGVDSIKDRFSTLGIVGMTVIQRLTNAGIDMVTKLGNGFRTVLNQIESGGKQRALNLEQAKFRLEGVLGSAEKVKQVMDDVDWAVKGTAYGLDEAAVSASMFAATGIEAGDTMKTTLRSVAGIAATFGTDFQTISNIMVDAAAAGRLTNDALTRLTMQGVPAMQLLQKEFGKTSEEIQKMATNGEISFEEFTKLMDNAYGKHAQDANKMFQGALANTRTALSRLGAKFYEPAFKFGIDIFNEFREDINSFSTGVDGAAKSFSTFGKIFTDSFVKNLQSLRDTGMFEQIGKGISNIVSALFGWRGILRTVKDAFVEAFPSVTIKNIAGLSNVFYELTSKFKELSNNTVFLEKLKNVMTGVFYIFKAVGNVVLGVVKVFVSFVKAIAGITNKTVDLSEGFANIGKALAKISGATDIFDFLASTVEGAGNIISKVFDTIFNSIKKLISGFSETIGGIDDLNGAMAMMGVLWTGLFGGQLLGKITFKMKSFLHIFTGVKDVIETFKQSAKSLPGNIGGTLTALTNSLNSMTTEVQAKALKQIALGVLALAVALKILSEIDNEGLAKGLGAVTTLLAEMVGALSILLKLLSSGEFAKSAKGIYALGSVTNALIKIGIAMILMASALKMISTLDPKQLASGLIGMTVMLGAVLGFVLVLDKYQNSVADTKVGLMMIGIALALSTMAKAVQILGSLKPAELAKGLGSIVVIMGAIFGFMAAISKMGVKSSGGMIAAGVGMIAIATAINILAPALQKLGSMSLEQIAKGLSAMAIAMVSMAAVSQSMSAGGAVGMLVMAVALGSLAHTIERIGSLDITTIAKGLGTIIVAIAALGAAAVILAPASAALVALGGAMILVSASIAIFGAGLIMIGAGLTSISAGIMSFASVSSTSLGMFVNTMKMVLLELISLIPSVAAKLAEGFVVFLEQIAALAPRFTEALTTLIHSLLEAVENNAPDIIAAGIRLVIRFLEGVAEATPRMVKAGVDIITGFLDGISEKMPEIIDSGINLILSFINGLAEGIRTHKNDFRKAIENLCMAGLEAFMSFFGIASPSTVMAEQGENLVLGLIQGIGNKIGEVPAKIIEGLGNLPSIIAGKASGFLSSGKTIMKNFIDGLGEKKDEIKKKFTKGVEDAKNALKNSSLYSVGKNLIQGFLDGLNSLKDRVTSFWNWLCDKAAAIVRKKNEIKSPSKLYFRFGSYIMQGLIKGLESLKDKPSDILGNMTDAMNEAVYKAYEAIDTDKNFNPTITPVLDLSQVKKDAGGINSMFGTESISIASSIGENDIQNIQNNNLMNQLITKMDRMLNSDKKNPVSISNTFTVNGNDNPEEFVNTFIRTLDREMQMRAV